MKKRLIAVLPAGDNDVHGIGRGRCGKRERSDMDEVIRFIKKYGAVSGDKPDFA